MLIDWPNLTRSLALTTIFAGLFVLYYPREEVEVVEPLPMTKDDCRMMLKDENPKPPIGVRLRFNDPTG